MANKEKDFKQESKNNKPLIDADIIEVMPDWKRSPQPDFVQMYLQDIGRLWELSSPAQKVFGEFMKLIEYSPKSKIHNLVEISKRIRKNMIISLGISNYSNPYVFLNRAIRDLIKAGVIIQIKDDETGEVIDDLYLVDPSICSKANWAHTELMRSIKLTITYTRSQRTLVTLIEQDPEHAKMLSQYYRREGKPFSPSGQEVLTDSQEAEELKNTQQEGLDYEALYNLY